MSGCPPDPGTQQPPRAGSTFREGPGPTLQASLGATRGSRQSRAPDPLTSQALHWGTPRGTGTPTPAAGMGQWLRPRASSCPGVGRGVAAPARNSPGHHQELVDLLVHQRVASLPHLGLQLGLVSAVLLACQEETLHGENNRGREKTPEAPRGAQGRTRDRAAETGSAALGGAGRASEPRDEPTVRAHTHARTQARARTEAVGPGAPGHARHTTAFTAGNSERMGLAARGPRGGA